VQDREMVAMEV